VKNIKYKKELKDGHIYRLHCMPFCRGSAAIGEWLQEAIYTSHGLEINSTGYDLKAISSPTLDEFMANAYQPEITSSTSL
jgi:hypothetical protein